MIASRRLALVIALALACVLAYAPPALAKDYHIASLYIGASVAPDGAMYVSEQREVEFNGDFHWAQWALNKRAPQGTTGTPRIELISITGPDGSEMKPSPESDLSLTPAPGTYILADEPDRLVLKVGFSASNETVRFVLRYKVTGAAKRWQDTSELYWQFVGSETDVRTDQVGVRIELPAGVTKQDVKAWAHGPLNGVVGIEEQEKRSFVTLDVTGLPPSTFVEGHVLFPASALPDAPVIDQPRAAAVLEAEGKLANEANAKRTRARTAVGLAYLAAFVFPIAMLGVVVWLWFRWGREYKPQFAGEYWRDIPEGVSTPLVGALWRFGEPDDATLGATLMDLALQGSVYMQPVAEHEEGFLGIGAHDDQTYQLTLDRGKLAQADPLERDLAAFVFDDTMSSDSFTIKQLREEAKAHPQAFTKGLSGWKSAVANRAENDLHWVEAKSRSMQIVSILLAVAAGFAVIVSVVTTESPLLALGLLPALAAFALAFQVKRRSPEAVELLAKYRGLRDYMRDFGRMGEKPPASVVLWERYLVLAVIFGIADEVIAQMRVAVPDVLNDPAFATAYWWASPTAYGDHSSPVGSLTGGFAAAVSAANSAMSSSSGGGGGFSGGGGGGGGGGGFSAG